MKKLLKKHPHEKDLITAHIVAAVESELSTAMATSKRATHRVASLFECRVGMGKLPDVRVAFRPDASGTHATVVYATTTTQKSEFTKELERFL